MDTSIQNRHHVLALGHALDAIRSQQFSKAETIGLNVIDEDPKNADAYFVAGFAAFERGNLAVALERLNQAITLQSDIADFYTHRGVVLAALKQPEEAIRDFNRTLKITPDDPSALANLARLYVQQGEARQALPLIQQALRHQPDDPVLLGDMAVILVQCKQPHDALPLYEQALRLSPNDAEIHCNYSRALLMVEQYPHGWQENEWRWHSRQYQKIAKNFPAPIWNGVSLIGKRITMVSEQGFGDALQFLRYAPLLKKKQAEVIVWCRPEL
ncbi:MAG: tetratricopeptide repeat protein, partial [Magnetococcales bacterium]|nr:tetratricopeptide repeat protein [Magnetococcales bacterium]